MLRSTRSARFVFAIAFAAFSTAAVSANAQILKGTVTTKMMTIKALYPNGSPDPGQDPACRSKYGNLLGRVATTTYEINTKTLMMSAAVTFEGQTHKLNALGLANSYSFGKFYNPPLAPLNMYAALFSLNKQGKNPVNTFSLVLNDKTNCAVSSAVNMW
jgi:hypothetical protein